MNVTFLSPNDGLLAVAVVLPLGALVLAELRSRRLRRALGLRRPGLAAVLSPALAVSALAALVGLAAAQPLLHRTAMRYARTDAEAFFIFDTSRSMLAASSPGGPTRFARARRAGLRLRAALPDVPVGIASLTDRLLPHLFPTLDQGDFERTLERAVGVERPPPELVQARATTLYPLAWLSTQNYFSPTATHRLAVVFTDGETTTISEPDLVRALGAEPPIKLVFVRFWLADERVFRRDGRPERGYRVDPSSGAYLSGLAAHLRARVFSEDELGAATRAARAAIGQGPRVPEGRKEKPIALAPWLALTALLPLGFLLWWRNLWGLELPGTPVRQAEPV